MNMNVTEYLGEKFYTIHNAMLRYHYYLIRTIEHQNKYENNYAYEHSDTVPQQPYIWGLLTKKEKDATLFAWTHSIFVAQATAS